MMFAYRSGLFCALAALALTGEPALADPILTQVNLRGAISAHLAHDWQLKAAAIELEASETAVWRSYAVFLPKINFSARFEQSQENGLRQQSQIAKLDFSMPLFTSGRNINLVLGAQSSALAQKYSFLSAEKRSAYAAVRTYANLYAQQAKVAALQRNVDGFGAILTGVAARHDAGLADFGEVSQARAVVLQAEQQLVLAQAALEQSRIDYKSETGEAAPRQVSLPDVSSLVPKSLKLALRTGRTNHPDILDARYKAEAANRLADATLGSYLPQVSLTGAYERAFETIGKSAGTDEWQIGVNLTMKLFDAESVPAVIEAKKKAQAIGFRALDAGHKIDYEIRSAWHAYHSDRESVRLAERRIDVLTSSLDVAAKKHRAGLVPVTDQLREKIALGNAEIELFQLKAKSLLSGYRLGFAANMVPITPILARTNR